MEKPKVFISRPILKEFLNIIEESCQVDMWDGNGAPPIGEKMDAIEGLMTYGHEHVTEEIIDSGRDLKVISNVGVGCDHIDIASVNKRGIPVGNTPGTLDDTTADMAFALLMATARNVVKGFDFIRSGGWNIYDPTILWGQEVHHATLGIIGMGRIGSVVARRGLGFDMRVLYHNRNRRPDLEKELGVEYRTLADLLAQSDFVVLCVPLTSETHRLIGSEELRRMKPNAILVNVARGPVVDSKALYKALKENVIAGAGLDVTDPEPIPADDPLLELDNIVIAPHLGSAALGARTMMIKMATENLLAGLRGEKLPYLANPEVYDKKS